LAEVMIPLGAFRACNRNRISSRIPTGSRQTST
jgi:hypothetical protein